jgi:cobalt-zinc-cadmium efflux system protein
MPHDHGHAGHHHPAAPASFDRAFAVGIFLNLAYVVLQAGFGFHARSLALLADAGHNLGDVLGLVLAWIAARLAKVAPGGRRSYGLRRLSILAALANGGILLLSVGAIAWEAVRRLSVQAPGPVAGGTVALVAAVGILVNGGTALLFMKGGRDLNLRAAFLHLASDAVISAGVVVSGLVILYTGWVPLDPLVTLVISGIILYGTWRLLADSVNLALDAVPPGIDPAAVAAHLAKLPGVTGVHHLHVWALSTTETALTVHLVRPGAADDDRFLAEAAEGLHHEFGIAHATLQVERGGAACAPDCHAEGA